MYGPGADPAQQQLNRFAQKLTGVLDGQKTGADGGDSKSAGSAAGSKTPAKPAKAEQNANAAPPAKKSGTSSAPATDSSQPKVADKGERDDLDFSKKPAKSIGSLYELIGTGVNVPNKQGGMTHYECPLNDTDTLTALLPLLLDKATTRRDSEIPARININTASWVVLTALPGLSDTDLQALLEHRPNPMAAQAPAAIFQSPAWLLTEAGFPPAKLIQLENYITTRSQSYRVQVVGYFDREGPMARAEAVIDTNNGRPRIVYKRDLTEMGRGFNLER
jgi:hypothetical protein